MRPIAGRHLCQAIHATSSRPSAISSAPASCPLRPLSSSSSGAPPSGQPPAPIPTSSTNEGTCHAAEGPVERANGEDVAPTKQRKQREQEQPQQQHRLPPTLERLSALYNDTSGVTELSTLKSAVSAASTAFDSAVRSVISLRRSVDEKTLAHDETSRQHASMLMKRDTWDANDAARFAEITAEEVRTRRDLARAREELRKAEDSAGRLQVAYMDAMRRRYHEEQLWQDKWRVLSTYWTWGLIGLNSVIFVGGQIFHYWRESGRLRRIEELIGEKISGVPQQQQQLQADTDLVSTAAGETVAAGDSSRALDGSKKGESDGGTAITRSSMGELQADDEHEAGEKVLLDGERIGEVSEVSPEHDRSRRQWFEKARNMIRSRQRRLQEVGHEDGKESDRDQQQHAEGWQKASITSWNDARSGIAKTVKGVEIHWPSAAVGAAAGAAGFLILSCCLGGRK